ncbi:MAG: hypothetical protein CMD78_02805 [Gammaproteobacteria bacterium]|nr:hypothetical protein [Gammaproteobacteria bacterium]
MIGKQLIRLSNRVYRLLKGTGVPLPTKQFREARLKSAGRGQWGEAKTALLTEISEGRSSGTSRLFNRKLLDRIEELGRKSPASPMTIALFGDGPQLQGQTGKTDHAEDISSDDFTDSQREALRQGRNNLVVLLMGAPGTGKTRVVSRLIRDYVNAGETTLLCCYTKSAVNHAVSRLDDNTRSSIFFRAGTFGSLIMEDDLPAFDNVVVDEAGMAHIAYILFLSGLATRRILLVGDPMQLGPIKALDHDPSPWLQKNIFQHQSGTDNLSELYAWQEKHTDSSVLLREQFDIPERIFSVINHFCYGNRLTCRSGGRGLISIIDTSELAPELIGSRRSPVNGVHGELVMSTLHDLLSKQSVTADAIGVITPFRAQSHHLKQLAASRDLPDAIEFGTIHTWQGRLKSAIVLDLTVSGVDHQFQVLSDSNQAMGLMNAALSRCRTHQGIEGRLIVIGNLEHMNTCYANGAITRVLNRLVSNADSVTRPSGEITAGSGLNKDDTQRYAQLTDTLVQDFNSRYRELSAALAGDNLPEEARIEALIWSGYDLIPRLIRLCNRLKRSNQPDWFNVSEDNMETLEQPVAALELSSLSENVRFSPGRISHFRAVISDLYMAIYESTMVRSATGRNQNPVEPVFDPDALSGDSYGRIRVWLKDLRNYYEHDTSKWEEWQRQNNKTQRDLFFQQSVGKPAPEKPQDYSSLNYLQATLFALKEVIAYLDTVRNKLKGNS